MIDIPSAGNRCTIVLASRTAEHNCDLHGDLEERAAAERFGRADPPADAVATSALLDERQHAKLAIGGGIVVAQADPPNGTKDTCIVTEYERVIVRMCCAGT